MQENIVSIYATIKNVKPPSPTGETNSRGQDLFKINATALATCGSIRDPETGTYKKEVREVDLCFNNLSLAQTEMISQNSEIFIPNATVLTVTEPIEYNYPIYAILTGREPIEGVSNYRDLILTFIQEAVREISKTYNSDADLFLSRLVRSHRRVTMVRVNPGQFSLKASERQISNGQQVHDDFES